MTDMDDHSPIWIEIDRAESYLVCCMSDEAMVLASSILKRLLENHNQNNKECKISKHFDEEWYDMLESSGMVLVQAMKQLKRASEILKELKMLFGSFTVVPVQVFLTGVCFQMSEGLSTTVQDSLEEFLNNWIYLDDRYYPLSCTEARESNKGQACSMISIEVEKYLEVVELYVVTLLAASVEGMDLAISWVEKSMLPMEKRRDLLRRLQSMSSSTVTSSSQTSIPPQLPDEYKSNILDQNRSNEHQKDGGPYLSGQRNYTVKDEILKLSRQRVPCFWWFPTINLKFGNIQLPVPSGKLLLASLLLIICYVTRKKQAMLKR
ncbi:hypothetical protein ACS0TY_033698 [Phlomoides rotata]